MKKAAMVIVGCALVLLMHVGLAAAGQEWPSNTFYGSYAGAAETNNSHGNTFIGAGSGGNVTSSGGGGNTFVGAGTGAAAGNTGNYNTFFGSKAGFNNTYGASNTFFGYYAGYSNTTGYNNVYIGYSAGYGYPDGTSNTLLIDNCYYADEGTGYCTKPFISGDFNTRILQISGQLIMTAAPAMISDARYKKNIESLKSSLEKVIKLNGVSFDWKADENPGLGFSRNKGIGLIAQDVEKVFPELVRTDEKGYKSLSYEMLTPVLVEAIKEQELSLKEKDARIEKQERALSALTSLVAELESKIKKLESRDMSAQK